MELTIGTSGVGHLPGAQVGPETCQEPEAIDSGELLRGRTEVLISHGDSIYSLRQTRQGKLILTK